MNISYPVVCRKFVGYALCSYHIQQTMPAGTLLDMFVHPKALGYLTVTVLNCNLGLNAVYLCVVACVKFIVLPPLLYDLNLIHA
jgi:hypothetical protein